MPLGRNKRREELAGDACGSWHSPPRNWWQTACVRLRFRTRLWSLAGGGAIGSLSGYSPARSLCPEESTSVNVPRRYNTWDKGARHTFALTPRSGLHFFSTCGALRPLVSLSPQVRPSASKTSPAKFGCNQETEHEWADTYSGYWDFDLRYLGH